MAQASSIHDQDGASMYPFVHAYETSPASAPLLGSAQVATANQHRTHRI
jgi:hypothetical protein